MTEPATFIPILVVRVNPRQGEFLIAGCPPLGRGFCLRLGVEAGGWPVARGRALSGSPLDDETDLHVMKVVFSPALAPSMVRLISEVGRWRIVLADDNAVCRRLVSRYLELMGADVRTVSDGRAALETATAWPPDLIIMDMEMPGIRGPGALAELARRGIRPKAILISASAPTDWGQDVPLAGRPVFLTKPFNRGVLLRCILALSSPSPRGPDLASDGS